MAKGLTEKQRKVLEHIIDYQKERGFPPTIREIGDAFGIGSLRGVTVHLDALVRKGFITRDRSSRSLRVIGVDPRSAPAKPPDDSFLADPGRVRVETVLCLPLLRGYGVADGAVTGGKFETTEALIERFIPIPEELAATATPDGFLIRVGASGVDEEPVVPGDLLVVRPQRSVLRGELAVYVMHGDLSVQRHPLTGGPNAPEIVGRVIGLLRRY
ncbi:MAG: hypothetical protein H7145_25285 [Akkermansiaceae bacterium]|nr:hypothetical protein [Armatimonadota bacterium]